MKKMYRMGIATLTACIFIVFMIRCIDDDHADPGPVCYVSLYNASPNAPDLDIIVDDEKINTVPFDYGLNTGYLVFSSGSRNLKFGPYGGSVITIDTLLTLDTDKNYSIFVVDEFEKASILRMFDDPTAPASGNARVRFLNLSPDSEPLQLKIKDVAVPLTSGQSFADPSNFMDLEAKSYIFEITSGGIVVDELPNTQIQSGMFYTIIVRGYVTPPADNTNVLSGEVIPN